MPRACARTGREWGQSHATDAQAARPRRRRAGRRDDARPAQALGAAPPSAAVCVQEGAERDGELAEESQRALGTAHLASALTTGLVASKGAEVELTVHAEDGLRVRSLGVGSNGEGRERSGELGQLHGLDALRHVRQLEGVGARQRESSDERLGKHGYSDRKRIETATDNLGSSQMPSPLHLGEPLRG